MNTFIAQGAQPRHVFKYLERLQRQGIEFGFASAGDDSVVITTDEVALPPFGPVTVVEVVTEEQPYAAPPLYPEEQPA